ncbi:MAG: hypothetical protein JW965_02015 [Bacteroidales bacterium]|nr:hypothetical protein [Bacteroidales bacterium]
MSLTINEVKSKYESSIMKIEGVVSLGIGKGRNNKPAIIIGLREKNKDTMDLLPSELEGYQVEIKILGTIRAN